MSATAVQDRGYWSKRSKFGGILGRAALHDVLQQRFPKYKDVKVVCLDESSESKSGPIDPLRNFLKKVLPKHLAWTQEERERRIITLPNQLTWTPEERERRMHDFLEGMSPEENTPFVDTLARFIVAITRGLSLVIPMLVMRLGETLPKSLTTVSVAVILFSALTSLMFKASNVETLGATAAYAAVLVVFVGTSH